jgi:hypothetical protein
LASGDREADPQGDDAMSIAAITAVWRPTPRRDWLEVEIVGEHAPSGQLVLREKGKFWPGVFLAAREHVRLAGREFWVR